tara:strand:- start:192 stop:431 length:240 start_codon:yes stop_codon:yes gene_type:complete
VKSSSHQFGPREFCAIQERITEERRSCKNPIVIRVPKPASDFKVKHANTSEEVDLKAFARKRLGAVLLLEIIQNENVVR